MNNKKMSKSTSGQRKELKDLNRDEYLRLKKSGMMWEFFPEATGDIRTDLYGNNRDK